MKLPLRFVGVEPRPKLVFGDPELMEDGADKLRRRVPNLTGIARDVGLCSLRRDNLDDIFQQRRRTTPTDVADDHRRERRAPRPTRRTVRHRFTGRTPILRASKGTTPRSLQRVIRILLGNRPRTGNGKRIGPQTKFARVYQNGIRHRRRVTKTRGVTINRN